MKRFILVFALLWAVCGSGQDVPQYERDALIDFFFNTNGANWRFKDNWLSNRPVREWKGVQTSTINGVEHVTSIYINNNNLTGTMSIVNLPMLDKLAIYDNEITAFTISGSNNLKELNIGYNPITSFDMSTLPTSLELLRLDGMSLTTLNIGHLTNLEWLGVANNQLSNFDFNTLPQSLIGLDITMNELTTVNVDGLPNLKMLGVGTNQLSNFDFTTLPSTLELLRAEENELTSIDLSNMTNLRILNLSDNQLSNFDFNTLPQTVHDLGVENNGLTTLDVGGFPNLRALYIANNQLSNFDFNALPQTMEELSIGRNNFTSIDVSSLINLKELDLSHNPISTPLDLNNHHQLIYLSAGDTQIPVVKLKSQMNYGSFGMYIGNAVKCIEVHNPALVNPNWYVTWLTGYQGNYRTDCSQYLATAENMAKTHHLTAVSPMGDTLILKGDAKVEKVEIYNTAGQLVKVLLDHDRDVSVLSKGVYFLKITTDKGVETTKVTK